MYPYNRRPGSALTEIPSSKHEIAKQMLSANAYYRDEHNKDHIELYQDYSNAGWNDGVDGSEFNKLYYPNTSRDSRDLMRQMVNNAGIVKKQSLLRGYSSESDPFTMKLADDILNNPAEYYKGNYRVGRGYGLTPSEDSGDASFYDTYNDNYEHLATYDPVAVHQSDILQDFGDEISSRPPRDGTRREVYYGSSSTHRR
jgi:hypothetical protein